MLILHLRKPMSKLSVDCQCHPGFLTTVSYHMYPMGIYIYNIYVKKFRGTHIVCYGGYSWDVRIKGGNLKF